MGWAQSRVRTSNLEPGVFEELPDKSRNGSPLGTRFWKTSRPDVPSPRAAGLLVCPVHVGCHFSKLQRSWAVGLGVRHVEPPQSSLSLQRLSHFSWVKALLLTQAFVWFPEFCKSLCWLFLCQFCPRFYGEEDFGCPHPAGVHDATLCPTSGGLISSPQRNVNTPSRQNPELAQTGAEWPGLCVDRRWIFSRSLVPGDGSHAIFNI